MGLKPASILVTLEIPLDWRVVLFTTAVTLATGVVRGWRRRYEPLPATRRGCCGRSRRPRAARKRA